MIIIKKLNDYLQLTKPRIMMLVVFTGAVALILEESLLTRPFDFILVLVALYLTGGSANALNQYFERDLDGRMSRTAQRRPLPARRIGSKSALIFSVGIGIAGVLIFGFYFNWYSALMSLLTILFYSLIYTLLLKPNTDQNIVIGGAAGAMAPVGAWVAASGNMEFAPWVLFLIIFFWTPPHFWALALFFKEDYIKTGLPMMPVVRGEGKTLQYIYLYTWILVASSFAIFVSEKISLMYGLVAAVLGIVFLLRSYQAKKQRSISSFRSLFGYSIAYLFILFIALMIDGLI